jgi:hypothetical protein
MLSWSVLPALGVLDIIKPTKSGLPMPDVYCSQQPGVSLLCFINIASREVNDITLG